MLVSPSLAEHLLFLPGRGDPGPPPTLDGVAGNALTLRTGDGVGIQAWWYARPERDAPKLLLLHGNAGTIRDRIPLARGLLREGVSVLLLEYRGYGGSEGKPSEAGLHADSRAGYEYLVGKEGAGGVILFGRSMGGAVAARLAGEVPVSGVILESVFTSLEAMARSLYPFLPGILFRRLRGRFATLDRVRDVEAPILVVHGTGDELVPLAMGLELFEAAGEPKLWMGISGAGHNNVFQVGGEAYFRGLARFARSYAGGGPPS